MSNTRRVRRFDTVVIPGGDGSICGVVKRVARDGSWADVRWVQASNGAVWAIALSAFGWLWA